MQLHGFKPEDAIIEINPRQGDFTLREEDILEVIEQHGSSIALVIFSGVQYYTGQWFPMQSITKAAKAQVRFYPFMPELSPGAWGSVCRLVMSGQDIFHSPSTFGVFTFQFD